MAAGGLVVAAEFVPARAALAAFAIGAAKMPGGIVSDPHVFVSIDPSGLVTIVAHRAGMGTGSRTSLPMAGAHAREAAWSPANVPPPPGRGQKDGSQHTRAWRSPRPCLLP